MVKAALGVPTTTALHPRHWVTKETDHENISKGNEENCTRVRSKTNSEPQQKMVRSTETVHKKKFSKKQTTKVQTCQLKLILSMPQNYKRTHLLSCSGFENVEQCIKIFKDHNIGINTLHYI
jgi:hypothetical protein